MREIGVRMEMERCKDGDGDADRCKDGAATVCVGVLQSVLELGYA